MSRDGHGDGSGKPAQDVDWPARHQELVLAEGDEYDRLHEAFTDEWSRAYTRAFIAFAVSRGWTQDDAESWPSHIVEAAMLEAATHSWSPIQAAEADVLECEKETG